MGQDAIYRLLSIILSEIDFSSLTTELRMHTNTTHGLRKYFLQTEFFYINFFLIPIN